ncbi:helix-hairpin-helix domain-containing protein [Weeksellaceae bacterium KMM 9713]|uniref:Helix-hairpin-helix domain-containing protein n=1 Tax=Profundicola chukchiensis TaxID=2961959 RepID=A0A9X4RW87_9FLAO|nr:helix-hairpin-helix domain-containing protein [Profundicola chukchiensis]MDG4946725.1 helix-hairpin-helix domain-containing protein [Profundicola chukchiensis]
MAELIIQFYPFGQNTTTQNLSFTPTEEALLLKQEEETGAQNAEFQKAELKRFNPNALDAKGFEELGFSLKQAESLIRYRNSLGGNFSSVEEFFAAYVMSDYMMDRLEPYIDIKPYAATLIKKPSQVQYENKYESKKSYTKMKVFDPNQLDANGWMELGFSENQVPVIFNYKNSLPGKRFETLEQIRACFVINEYMFNRIKDYVRITNSPTLEVESKEESKLSTASFNPNKMSVSDWEALGWDKADAENIIKYKEFIGGFKNLADLEKCKYISSEDLEKFKNRMVFE